MPKNNYTLKNIGWVVALMAVNFCSQHAYANWVHTGHDSTGNVNCFDVIGNKLLAATTSGLFISTNNGNSWDSATGLPASDVITLETLGNKEFAGTDGDGIYVSADSGKTWAAANTGVTDMFIHSFVVKGTSLFAGGVRGGVFLSTNNGTSWSAVNTGLATLSVVSFLVDGNNLLAFLVNGTLYKSTNNGTSWTDMNAGLPPLEFVGYADGSTLYAGSAGYLMKSINGGSTWTSVFANLPANEEIGAIDKSGSNLLVAVDNGGIGLSKDNGVSWSLQNTGLTNTHVFTLLVYGNNVFVGTLGAGMWVRPLAEVLAGSGIKSVGAKQKSSLQLDKGRVSFTLAQASPFSLTLCNLQGQTIKTLSQGWEIAGQHTFPLQTFGMQAGIYVLEFKTDALQLQQKISIEK